MKNLKNLKIVTIGGGTGMPNLLRGLKRYFDKITAVVTVTDDGLTTGPLRRDFNIIAPGDVRKCIIALADEENLYNKLFSYKFPHGRGLKGHNFGNLFLVALEDITGSFKKAVQEISQILAIKGKVLPSTYQDVILSAKMRNGRVAWGQVQMATAGHRSPIDKISLHPESATANPDVIKAIKEADIIIIGPGSLYSSIIPNFLFKEINAAVGKSRAKKIFVCNVSTERGETENYDVSNHINCLVKHSNPKIFDICLVNNRLIQKTSGRRLGEVKNITSDKNKISKYEIVSADLIDNKNPLMHDSNKLANAIIKILERK
ncbi:hypothetical protein A2V71_02445 [Candidatus Berkelbacteria bacterium RBG_13_40_8]|uniref:Putative gluconeogenesis factor n=1 Tax=Candidatus Berkelbacteria bacterium RBG_13_40_8 TaxID=1797467 RepID=A0A1F5DN01_9BACT|nr:MAG: hypothetical protein A2V71_02445 [Candidatus Berkelbacteria bacterium RBG_13_40_8]